MVSGTRIQIDLLAARYLLALVIDGTPGDDLISLLANGPDLVVSVNGVGTHYDSTELDLVQISAGDGADAVTLLTTQTLPVSVDGGSGDDTLSVGRGDWRANSLANVTLRGGPGTDWVVIDDSLAPPAQVSVTNPFNIDTQFTSPGAGTIYVDAGTPESTVEQIDYLGGSGADQVNILGLSSLTSLRVFAGAGEDSIYVGNDFDSSINGALTVDGGTDANALVFDDSADGFGDAYLFAGTFASPTLGKDSTAALLRYTNFSRLQVIAGTAGSFPNNQFFRVGALPNDIDLTIDAGSGDDVLTLGSVSIDLATIQGKIQFNGENGFDRISVFDLLGSDAATYSVAPDLLQISGQLPLSYTDIQFMTVRGNGAGNTFDVQGTNAPLSVTLDGGGGNDTFFVGAGDIDSTIGNSVSIVGGSGLDQLIIDDSLDDVGNDTYTFTAGILNRAVTGILWSTELASATERVDLLGSAQSDTIRVLSASPTVQLRIQAGDGNDSIAVESTSNGTTPAVVTVVSGDGADTLTVNSDQIGADAIVAVDEAFEALALLNIRAGGRLNVAAGATRLLKIDGALSVQGTLDLNDQTLVVANGSFAALEGAVTVGFSDGAWTTAAPGAILSSFAAESALNDALAVVTADSVGLPIYAGVATAAGDVIVRYTLNADANLDRSVGFEDLLSLSQSYDPQTPGRHWIDGNFNYQTADVVPGAVGFDDLLMLAQNYGLTLAAVQVVHAVATESATNAYTLRRIEHTETPWQTNRTRRKSSWPIQADSTPASSFPGSRTATRA